MSEPTFKELERSGWRDKAVSYDDWAAKITAQAIEPILDAIGPNLSGLNVLDVCTGTGHLLAAAVKRGAAVEGVDFADEMVAKAWRNYPNYSFHVGNAENLPYPRHTFHRVICSCGLLHLDNPEKAIAEAHRVLVPGGRYAFTVWCGPDQGGEFFQIVFKAIEEHGSLDVSLPPAPPLFRLADPEESRAILTRTGFNEVRTSVLDLSWDFQNGEELLDFIYKSTVRLPMVLDRQASGDRERIHAAILSKAESCRVNDKIRLAFPMMLVVGERE